MQSAPPNFAKVTVEAIDVFTMAVVQPQLVPTFVQLMVEASDVHMRAAVDPHMVPPTSV